MVLIGSLALVPLSLPAQTRPRPQAEPVAETRLLMEGMALANFQGLNRQLRQQPTDPEAWVFLRGQALLIAETGNLLILRPPRNAGEAAWQDHAADLRGSATRLARAAGARDYERSKVGLAELATVCNRCHQTFRVPVRLPLREEDKAPR
jgi:hypothetical protein